MNIIKSRKNKNTILRPDYILKDIPMSERANLPDRMKILLYLHIHSTTIPAWMFHDCMKRYPEYFEKDNKIYGATKSLTRVN